MEPDVTDTGSGLTPDIRMSLKGRLTRTAAELPGPVESAQWVERLPRPAAERAPGSGRRLRLKLGFVLCVSASSLARMFTPLLVRSQRAPGKGWRNESDPPVAAGAAAPRMEARDGGKTCLHPLKAAELAGVMRRVHG
ncbi:hypothetical protein NDU88_012949 [Pleurodeles waltl]|uniref:Uncharacterized protein n=1 Tax=Pleurodeles waltl TaxID=8319 RepID=A0AAV7R297_PLEWA|nr:hypothetical protein NDU88_012949 [Pleurodeles waltl]